MASILCIDTALELCSVALSVDGKCIHAISDSEKNNASSHLHLFIKSLLKESNLLISKLDAVALVNGPGSYTGLRIASSTAKGICYALSIPMICISTFEVLHHKLINTAPKPETFDVFVHTIDARREEVFIQVNNIIGETLYAPQVVDLQKNNEVISLINQYSSPIISGSGSKKVASRISSEKCAEQESLIFNASDITEIAYKHFLNANFSDIAYSEPLYLKPAFTTSSNKKLL